MKKLNLTPEEEQALKEAWEIQLPEDAPGARFAEYKIMTTGTPDQKRRFYEILIMQTNAEQKAWREWFIKSGLIKWLVLCEAEKGTNGLAKRINQEWGRLAEVYDLKEHFNKAYKDVTGQQN